MTKHTRPHKKYLQNFSAEERATAKIRTYEDLAPFLLVDGGSEQWLRRQANNGLFCRYHLPAGQKGPALWREDELLADFEKRYPGFPHVRRLEEAFGIGIEPTAEPAQTLPFRKTKKQKKNADVKKSD